MSEFVAIAVNTPRLYGPFRDALDSAPRGGDKKTYQMDFRSDHDIDPEVRLDEEADWLMVKPGQPYLDVLYRTSQISELPLAVYQVGGEYAAIHASAKAGVLDYQQVMLESMASFRRAGADIIFTYAALKSRGGFEKQVSGIKRQYRIGSGMFPSRTQIIGSI